MELGPSQRSLHNAPIFRLLLKVAVKGTHQCDLSNFCGGLRVPNVRPTMGNSIDLHARCIVLFGVVWFISFLVSFIGCAAVANKTSEKTPTYDETAFKLHGHPYCYPEGCAAPGKVQCQCDTRGPPSKLERTPPPQKNKCDKQVSSWRRISCHTDENRYCI